MRQQGTSTHSPLLVVLETIDLEFVSHFRPHAPPESNQTASLGKSTMAGSARQGATALQPLLTSATLHPRFLAQNFPTFVEDPIYGDTIYLHHNFGAHALWFGWIEDVGRSLIKSLAKEESGDGDGMEVLQQLVRRLTLGQEGLSSATQLLDTVDPTSK
jgi:nucleoporin NUP82